MDISEPGNEMDGKSAENIRQGVYFMPHQLSEEEIYQVARKRVEEKKAFYTHLATYVVVNAMLVLIWAFTSRGYP